MYYRVATTTETYISTINISKMKTCMKTLSTTKSATKFDDDDDNNDSSTTKKEDNSSKEVSITTKSAS